MFKIRRKVGKAYTVERLVEVNLMCTEVTALLHSTFAHCVAMADIWLPPRLTQIGKEVFLNCIALREVVIPTELQDRHSRLLRVRATQTVYAP